jgi:murein DD-endopeptidase MepM/ murein hydrolase activator NlpD
MPFYSLLCLRYKQSKLLFYIWGMILQIGNYQTMAQTQAKDSLDLPQNCGDEEASPYFESLEAFNPTKLQNPIPIHLYNIAKKQYWSPPLLNTRLKTSGFGIRWGVFHHGIDLALNTGTPILAAFDGTVKLATAYGGYGNCVIITHINGLETLYGHLSRLRVRVGQKVKAGQMIGRGGSTGYSTGPHLHFETRYKGYSFNPGLIFDFAGKNQMRNEHFFLKPHHFRHYGNPIKPRNYLFHQVGGKDTLHSISQKYAVSITQIKQYNRLFSETLVQGQILRIK